MDSGEGGPKDRMSTLSMYSVDLSADLSDREKVSDRPAPPRTYSPAARLFCCWMRKKHTANTSVGGDGDRNISLSVFPRADTETGGAIETREVSSVDTKLNPSFLRHSQSDMSITDDCDLTLEDLQFSPTVIDKNLDASIKKWEKSFRSYEDMETISLEKVGPSLVNVLIQLREDPDAFINSTDPAIQSLARQRSTLHRSGIELSGISSTDIKDGGTSPLKHRRQSIALTSTCQNNKFKTHHRRGSTPDMRPQSLSFLKHGSAHYPHNHRLHMRDEIVSNSREAASLADVGGRVMSVDRVVSPLHHPQESGSSPNEVTTRGTIGTRELSLLWAGRLAEVTPTQGEMSKQVGDSGEVVGLKIRPKWPVWLSDSVYDVIKTNKYGKKQRRTIKLTEYHMLNIKEGKIVTKIVPYDSIIKTFLVSEDDFCVEYSMISGEDLEEGSLRYSSLLAAHIVQQLTTRAQVRQALDTIGHAPTGKSSHSVGYSAGATAAMIESIAEESNREHSDIAQFARSLGRRARDRLQSSGIEEESNGTDSNHPLALNDAEYASRLLSIEPGSGEFKVQNAVQRIILNPSTPEGNTARHFIDGFPDSPLDRNMTELRHFIEGMYEYVVENHGVDLAMLLRSDESFRMSDLQEQMVSKSSRPHTTPVVDLTDEALSSISFISFSVVEEALFLSLQDKISSYCDSTDMPERSEDVLLRKMRVLSSRAQIEWDIPEYLTSPAEWKTAVFELAGIERNPTPSMRLNALVRTAHAIYTEYKSHVLPQMVKRKKTAVNDGDSVLGADDFLPIFIYVFCRSELRHPFLNKDILWKLCHPDQLHGESGYYLTIYESAVEYIYSMEVNQEELDQVQIRKPDYSRTQSIAQSPGIAKAITGKLKRRISSVVGGHQSSQSVDLGVSGFAISPTRNRKSTM